MKTLGATGSRWVLLWAAATISVPPSIVSAQDPEPILHRWQIQSFFEDAELTEKSVFCIDFTDDGSLWAAVSDGLYFFDGYRWQHYTTDHGLPSNYVRSVCVTKQGIVWIGTDAGAGTFVEGRFDHRGTPGNIAGPSVRRIVEENDGSLWFCCDQWPDPTVRAGLTRLQHGKYTTWRQADGLPSDYVSDYIRDSMGRQFVLTNEGLAQIDGDQITLPILEAGLWERDNYVWSLVESTKYGLLAATNNHFYVLKDEEWKRFPNLSKRDLPQPKLVATRDGEIFTCRAGSDPRILKWNGDRFEPVSYRLRGGSIQYAAEDDRGAIWFCGYERLFMWERTYPEWKSYIDIGFPCFKDNAGGVWFGREDGGLHCLRDGTWTRYDDLSPPVMEDANGQVWMRSADGIAMWTQDAGIQKIDTPLLDPVLANVDSGGRLWIFGTTEDSHRAAAVFDGSWQTIKMPSAHATEMEVCYSTLDPDSGIWIVLGKNELPPFNLLHVTDESATEISIPQEAQISDAPKVVALPNGELLLAGFFGILARDSSTNKWSRIETPTSAIDQVHKFHDEYWFSNRGHLGGVASMVRLKNREWTTFEGVNGVLNGLERQDQLIVSSLGRFMTIEPGAENFGPAVKLPLEVRAASFIPANTSEGDAFWVGIGSRTYLYTPDDAPPETTVTNESEHLFAGDVLKLTVDPIERFKPSMRNRYYHVSYKVDSQPWTQFEPLVEDTVLISDLSAGQHTVRVRIKDASGQIDTTPVKLDIQVLPMPLQSRWWFKPVVSLCFVTFMFLAVIASWNWKRARQLASGLEKEVEHKTRRLSESDLQYRRLFEDSQDAICLFGMDGELKNCNRAATELLGVSHERSFRFADLFANAEEEQQFQQQLQNHGFLIGARFKVLDRRRQKLNAIISANTWVDGRGNNEGYQVIIRDISDLVSLQNKLFKTEKMEAVGRMAGGIAHDFNNFLAVIMYGVELIHLNKGNQDNIQNGINVIRGAAERGKTLTSQIQTFSSAPVEKQGVVDTKELFTGLPELLRGIVPAQIELEIDIGPDIGCIQAEQHQLEQILLNLVINACHATPDGGKIRIEGAKVEPHQIENIEGKFLSADKIVLLQVTDTGAGMNASTRERIFEPFFSTKPQGQGSGLGLAIVYGIVQKLNGQILVNSDVGKGTNVQLVFPVCHGTPNAHDVGTELVCPIVGTESILLVEDGDDFRNLVGESLTRCGYTVHTAENGDNAKVMLNAGLEVDLVISDVVMPGTDGFELIEWIGENYPEQPILLISGHPHPGNEARHDIDVPILRKPFSPFELASRVRKIFDEKIVVKTRR